MRKVNRVTRIKIAPSILAADMTRLGEEIGAVLRGGADYIHVDVMDGHFVPNISFGLPVVQSVRRAFPDAFLDVHLMIEKPGRYVEAFCDAGASLVDIHVEADDPVNITTALEQIRARGVKTGLALKPATGAEALIPWLEKLDLVLAMTVEPGFGAQRLIDSVLPKISAIRGRLSRVNPACDIEVDGGVNLTTAPLVIKAGANVLVSGSAVFGHEHYGAIIEHLRTGA